MTRTPERRTFTVGELRVDAAQGAMAPKISGHAAMFEALSEDLGGFREKIAAGAFTKTLASADIRALFNHDPNIVLGRNAAGTLRLKEDINGLAIEIDPPDTQQARDLMVSMQRGDITQMSFGFYTVNDKWAKIDGGWVRTLLEVELFDVSPVTYPAYTQTDVAVRSLEQAKKLEVPSDDGWRTGLMRRRLDLTT
ncbi:MAG: HK97 family phage prohead protease [Pseudomonadota bacterium]